LGSLENEYSTDPKKIRRMFIKLFLFALIGPPIVIGLFTPPNSAKLFTIIAGCTFLIVGVGGIMLGLYIHYKNLHIYIYSNGLFCLNGDNKIMIYWQQIKKAYAYNGYLNIMVKNGPGVRIPIALISDSDEFSARVKQEIANQRNLG
jgi:hypothetical protein